MKRLLYLILPLLLLTTSCTPLELDEYILGDAFEGSGTESSPYLISNSDELRLLSILVNNGESMAGIYFKLTNDINLEGKSNNQWTPIGTQYHRFEGIFDGNNHKIADIYIKSFDNGIGLFGFTFSATIKNIRIYGTITGSQKYIGAIIGKATDSQISNCYNMVYISGIGENMGGIVGYSASSTIIYCYNTGHISGCSNVGGIAGDSSGSITDCYNTGTVSGDRYIGGVVGDSSGSITDCYNTCYVLGESFYTGGIAGDSSGSITGCHNTGSVSGGDYAKRIGGIAGNSSNSITDCYNAGNVSGGSYAIYIGGISGDSSDHIDNCYNISSVSGHHDIGGIAGNSSDSIANCYNTGYVLGEEDTGEVIGKSSNYLASNCYWLSECCTNGNDKGIEKSESEMKSDEMVTLLNGEQDEKPWKSDT